MQTRLVLRGLLLALAGLGLHGCGGGGNSSSCNNLLGGKCDPSQPGGTINASPNPATEGQIVKFTFDIADQNPAEPLSCKLDPEGDGVFQLNVPCKGSFNVIYQRVGVFAARVRVTDDQAQEITTQSVPVTVNQAAGGNPVTQFRLQTLERTTLTGANVCVVQPGEFECDPDIQISAGADGTYTVVPGLPQDAPAAAEFRLLLTFGDERVILNARVDNDNLANVVNILTPVDCDASGLCEDALETDNPGVITTLSGVVTSTTGNRIAGAQVSITGGVKTGGPYSTVFTDANGQFDLPINVGNSLKSTIALSDLLIFAPGFQDVVSQVEVSSKYFFGLNFQMEPLPATETPLFRETFEEDSPTAAQWTVAPSTEYVTADPAVRWQLVTSVDSIVNSAVGPCVRLPPGDVSAGRLPVPLQGLRAFWYGKKETGNFIGVGSCAGLSGGTSDSANSGTLTSPPIDLGGIGNTPVRLQLKTYWEIESVNPNSGGFDLMKVKMSTDNGATFADVGRLNPLSDPVFSGDRSPLAFTNTGFNSPALWLQQESFALPEAGGKTIRLRFEFDTVDGLYNGFRGWMLDDVVVERGQGRLAPGQ